jgi:hypothetical protein
MVHRATHRVSGFLGLHDLVGEPMPTLAARPRLAQGTVSDVHELRRSDGGIPAPGEMRAPARGAEAREIRVRLVELLASEAGHTMRNAITREIAGDGRPLPAAVLRALATLARDADPRVRRAASSTLVHLLEAMSPIVRSELIVRLATSSRFELRLLIAQALRHGALGVGTVTALEHLVDDPEPEVRAAALVSARLRMAEAPHRMGVIVRRKLQHL